MLLFIEYFLVLLLGLLPAIRAFYMDRYFRLGMQGEPIGFVAFFNTLPLERLIVLYFWIHPVRQRSVKAEIEKSRRKVNIFTYAFYITIILFSIFALLTKR